MLTATPKFLKHKKSGRVYPYHEQLAKLGDEVEPFDMPKPAPKSASVPVVAAKSAPEPIVEIEVEVEVAEVKPDRMAAARAARAAKAAQKKAAVGQPDEPVDDPAPLTVNAKDVDAALGRITEQFEDATGD